MIEKYEKQNHKNYFDINVADNCGGIYCRDDEESMNSYKAGFGLIAVKCLNCAFDESSLDPEFETKTFPLKEELFHKLITSHDEDVKVQQGIYKCTKGHLIIKFCHTNEIIIENKI